MDRPLRIIDLQLPRIEAEGLSEIYSVERRLIPILVRMRRRGVRVDVEGDGLVCHEGTVSCFTRALAVASEVQA